MLDIHSAPCVLNQGVGNEPRNEHRNEVNGNNDQSLSIFYVPRKSNLFIELLLQ